VTVFGTNFRAATGVSFGAVRGLKVTVHTAATLTVVAPAHVAGTVDVRVLSKSGTSTTSSRDHFSYEPSAAQVSVGNADGGTFSCAIIKGVGTAECWGGNGSGEIGIGTRGGSAKVPRSVHGLGPGVQEIAAGSQMACAVTKSGGAKCWGWEYFGQLGNGVADMNGYVDTPTNVVGLTSGVRSIAVGNDNGCVVTNSGVVECWGSNGEQQLGPNASGQFSTTPVIIAGLPGGIRSVVVGQGFACALTGPGAVLCWGWILGNGSAEFTQSPSPVSVTGLTSGAGSLTAGGLSACAVTSGGAAVCWGGNDHGQLGNGSPASFAATPVGVKGLGSGVARVAIGDSSACALTTRGAAKCWGYNYDGTLGNGSQTDSRVPVNVRGLGTGGAMISVSSYTSCAGMAYGTVECWGYVPVGAGISDVPVTLPWFG
jgi:alpha-tubulin suppressor-like RCC1 family protein